MRNLSRRLSRSLRERMRTEDEIMDFVVDNDEFTVHEMSTLLLEIGDPKPDYNKIHTQLTFEGDDISIVYQLNKALVGFYDRRNKSMYTTFSYNAKRDKWFRES